MPSQTDTLYSILRHNPETLKWALSVSTNKLIAAINIGRWAIERVIDLGVTDEDTATIITQAKEAAKQEADEAAHAVVTQFEQDMRKVMIEKDLELHQKTLELDAVQRNLKDKDAKIRDMDTALKNIVKEFCEGELKDLRKQVQDRENEIKSLRNTNAAKCVIGESLIMDTLRNIYTVADIQHTGKQAHECDIHLKDAENDTIIFESKYKNSITKGDVDKFYYDVSQQPADRQLIGAVFISLTTQNIPTKGNLFLEFHQNTTPLLFVGFKTPEEFTVNFPSIIDLFMKLCKYQSLLNKQTQSSSTLSDESNKMKFQQLTTEIESTLSIISSNRSRINDLRKIASDLEDTNKQVITNLNNMSTIIDPHHTTPIPINQAQRLVRPPTTRPLYTCEKCTISTFTNKKELAKHLRSCQPNDLSQ
jgi:hypothetical protein